MRTNITLGELLDTAAVGIAKRLAKYVLILYVAQAVLGGVVGVYLGVTYTDEVMELITSGRNQ